MQRYALFQDIHLPLLIVSYLNMVQTGLYP